MQEVPHQTFRAAACFQRFTFVGAVSALEKIGDTTFLAFAGIWAELPDGGDYNPIVERIGSLRTDNNPTDWNNIQPRLQPGIW